MSSDKGTLHSWYWRQADSKLKLSASVLENLHRPCGPTFQRKNVPRGEKVGVKWRVTHMTSTQESYPELIHMVFLPELNQRNMHLVRKTCGVQAFVRRPEELKGRLGTSSIKGITLRCQPAKPKAILHIWIRHEGRMTNRCPNSPKLEEQTFVRYYESNY